MIEGSTIGERIRNLRESRGATQFDLLKIVDRKRTSQSWIARVESGEKNIWACDLKKIAVHFGVSVDELIP